MESSRWGSTRIVPPNQSEKIPSYNAQPEGVGVKVVSSPPPTPRETMKEKPGSWPRPNSGQLHRRAPGVSSGLGDQAGDLVMIGNIASAQ